jgi:CBS domain containing-hemolysin-like protein
LLTLGTAFFVAGEFALVASDRPKIERLAAQGDRRARSALRALKTLSFQLSGAQLGITITSLTVGFIAEPTIAEALDPLIGLTGLPEPTVHGISIGVALFLATAVQMVLGELMPKNLALSEPVGLALWIAAPMRLVNATVKPIIVLLNNTANATVRLMGIQPRDELTSVHSLEELEVLIRSSRAEGTLEEEQFSLLSRSISFGGKTAADALVPRVSMVAIQRDKSLSEMAGLALETGYSRFPVYGADMDDIVGTVHVKDTYRIPMDRRDETSVLDIMQEAMIVPESRTLESLLLEMRSERKQMAIVVDEHGGTAGIITLEDLLEEIVGDIEDEYDPSSTPRMTSSPKGVHVVSAMLHPDEIERSTGFVMPEGDYETLAGFLLTLFDRIPEQGAHIAYNGWEFKVVEMDGKRISRVLLVAPAQDAAPSEGRS